MIAGTLSVSWGRYGGFYARRWRISRLGSPWRVCAGVVAITYLPVELDEVMHLACPAPAEDGGSNPKGVVPSDAS